MRNYITATEDIYIALSILFEDMLGGYDDDSARFVPPSDDCYITLSQVRSLLGYGTSDNINKIILHCASLAGYRVELTGTGYRIYDW